MRTRLGMSSLACSPRAARAFLPRPCRHVADPRAFRPGALPPGGAPKLFSRECASNHHVRAKLASGSTPNMDAEYIGVPGWTEVPGMGAAAGIGLSLVSSCKTG